LDSQLIPLNTLLLHSSTHTDSVASMTRSTWLRIGRYIHLRDTDAGGALARTHEGTQKQMNLWCLFT